MPVGRPFRRSADRAVVERQATLVARHWRVPAPLASRSRAAKSMENERQMIRCSTCGRRVVAASPVCPVHGPVPPAPAPPPDETPTYVVPTPELPGFRVRQLLGRGGFGAVFLADRTRGEDLVAIKVARADILSASEALLREADALHAVGPPHVPAVYARGRLDD